MPPRIGGRRNSCSRNLKAPAWVKGMGLFSKGEQNSFRPACWGRTGLWVLLGILKQKRNKVKSEARGGQKRFRCEGLWAINRSAAGEKELLAREGVYRWLRRRAEGQLVRRGRGGWVAGF